MNESTLSFAREERLKSAIVKSHLSHTKRISSLSWSCTGHLLASGSQDQTIRLWSLDHATGALKKPTDVLRGHSGTVDALAWHPTDANVLASGSSDRSVMIWNTKGGGAANVSVTRIELKGQTLSLSWSVDGSFLFAGTREDMFFMIEGRRGAIVMQHQFNMELNEFALTPSGLIYCAMGNRGAAVDEGMVIVCKLVQSSSPLKATTTTSTTTPSSNGSSSTTATTTSTTSSSSDALNIRWVLEEVVRVKANASPIISLKFSPSFSTFATGAGDSIVSLWDSSEVACVRTIDKADSQIRGVSFSFSGEHLAVACGDKDESNKTLDIFRVTDGARIRSVPVRESCSVNYVAWAPQSMVLAFALDEPLNAKPAQAVPPGTLPPPSESGALRLLVAN